MYCSCRIPFCEIFPNLFRITTLEKQVIASFDQVLTKTATSIDIHVPFNHYFPCWEYILHRTPDLIRSGIGELNSSTPITVLGVPLVHIHVDFEENCLLYLSLYQKYVLTLIRFWFLLLDIIPYIIQKRCWRWVSSHSKPGPRIRFNSPSSVKRTTYPKRTKVIPNWRKISADMFEST